MDNSEKAEKNKNLIFRYGTALSATDGPEELETVMRKFTDNESYIRAVLTFRNAFPDYTIFVEDLTAEGDYVVSHGIFRGTHKGEIHGIPATFRKVELPMMIKYHVLCDKIISALPMMDQMELFEQLGAINKPV